MDAGPTYLTAKITPTGGMDRISSDLMLESDPQNVMFFPYMQAAMRMTLNLIDNEAGALNKRGGSVLHLDNPNGLPVMALIQYATNLQVDQQIMLAGNEIFMWPYQGNSWNSPLPAPYHLSVGLGTGAVGTELTASTTYYYKVTCVNAVGETTASMEAVVSEGSTVVPIDLIWSNINPASSYNVYRSTATGTEVLIKTGITTNSFTDSGNDVPGTATPPTTTTAVGPIYILTAMDYRLRYARLNGYLFLSNGVDPLLAWDGDRMYVIENNSASTYLSANVATTDTTINVTSTDGFFPNSGFFLIGAGAQGTGTEVIQYQGTTSTSFINCVRGYNNTPVSSYTAGTDVNMFFGAPPANPEVLYQWNNRVYAGNLGNYNRSTVQWSAARNQTTDGFNWMLTAQSTSSTSTGQPTGAIDESLSQEDYIDQSNGQQITGLQSEAGKMFIFKNESVYLATPDANGVPTQIILLDAQYGTQSQESIVHLDGSSYWFTQEGVVASTTAKPVLQTYNIMDLALNVPGENQPSIAAGKHNFKLYFSVGVTTADPSRGGETYQNAVLVFNYLTKHWSFYTYPFLINVYAEMYDANTALQLYYGDSQGNTYQYDPNIYNDNGVPIPVEIETRFYFFKEPEKAKDYLRTSIFCQSEGNGEVQYSTIDTVESNWKKLMNLPRFFNRQDFPERGTRTRGIRFKVIESSSAPFTFRGITQEYEEVS